MKIELVVTVVGGPLEVSCSLLPIVAFSSIKIEYNDVTN